MRTRLLLAGLLTALPAAAARAAPPPPADPDAAVRALESPRWEERRGAERDLVRLGEDALAAQGEEGVARTRAWDEALARAQREGGPGTAEAVDRVLRRLEPRATDDQVRRVPRLLRLRVERLVGQLVVPRVTDPWYWAERGEASLDAWRIATLAMDGLRPEAGDALLEVVRACGDPRRVAGALAVLVEGDPAAQARLATAIGEAWAEDPERLLGVAEFAAPASTPPIATVALALAQTGRSRELPRLRPLLAQDPTVDLGALLRTRLLAQGDGDLALGEFLARLERGEARVSDETEAARRAAASGLPWLARLLARRALFLEPDGADARETLVAADRALGLTRTARLDARQAPGEAADDPTATAVDRALRAGRLTQRLLRRVEAGQAATLGLAPVALGEGFVVYGTTRGRVVLEDLLEETERASESTRVSRLPRALALSGGQLAALTARGGVYFWAADRQGLRRGAVAAGPFLDVAPAPDGFWFLGRGRSVWRRRGAQEPRQVAVAGTEDFAPTRLAGLTGGEVLLWGGGQVVLLEATGTASRRITAGPMGASVVVAEGEEFRVLAPDGTPRGGGRLAPGTRILGVAGDDAIGTVYVATADALYACRATDGAVRWVEQVEGSGNPVLAPGLVAVSAGLGTDEGGDNRWDRTISVLRADTGTADPFDESARRRAAAAAVAAAEEDRPGVAVALLDPLASWLSPAERQEAEARIAAARARAASPR